MNLRIEQLSVEGLAAYGRNARTHSEAQVAQIAGSIAEFGFVNPVLIDEKGTIIAGHGRVLAARKLGLTDVPVVRLDHLTDIQRRALTIADNRIAEGAGWDEQVLAGELSTLAAEHFDMELVGFDDGELERLLADASGGEDGAEAEENADDEAVPEAPAHPVSLRGDVWQLGEQRLICGDACDLAVVSALMQGERAALVFTSPPYANQRDYASGGIGDWDALMQGVVKALPIAEDGQLLVNLGLVHRDNEYLPYWDAWSEWMRTQGWRRFAWYVWDQGPGMPGDWNGRLAPSFEFVFHFNRAARKPNKIVPCKHAGQEMHLRADGSSSAMRKKDGEIGGWSHAGQPTQEYRIPDSVIRIMRHKGGIGDGIDHPAVFPVALPEHVLEAYSNAGDVCYEPFGGSGTTLLAAQRLGRRGRAVELAPEYVDVAIKRFAQNFPEVPVTLAATGQDFEAVTAARGVEIGE